MIEEFTSDREQGEIIGPRIHEKFDRGLIDAEGERFEEGDKRVHDFLVIKVEFERDQLVEEGVRQNVVCNKETPPIVSHRQQSQSYSHLHFFSSDLMFCSRMLVV